MTHTAGTLGVASAATPPISQPHTKHMRNELAAVHLPAALLAVAGALPGGGWLALTESEGTPYLSTAYM